LPDKGRREVRNRQLERRAVFPTKGIVWLPPSRHRNMWFITTTQIAIMRVCLLDRHKKTTITLVDCASWLGGFDASDANILYYLGRCKHYSK